MVTQKQNDTNTTSTGDVRLEIKANENLTTLIYNYLVVHDC